MRATVSLGGDGSVPYEIELEGFGAPFDQVYAPAGGWRGETRSLFLTAADELVAKDLAGTWLDPAGQNLVIAADGAPPYRVRLDKELYTPDIAAASKPLDLLLLPADPLRPALGCHPARAEHPRPRAGDLRGTGRGRVPARRPGSEVAAPRGAHERPMMRPMPRMKVDGRRRAV